MPEKMYFCYELDFACRWSPAVYHGDKPGKRMEGEPERSTLYPVPPECVDEFGNPQFGKLQRMFPPPQEKEEDEATLLASD